MLRPRIFTSIQHIPKESLDSGEVNGTTTKLTFSNAARTLRACRAYFQFTDEIGSEARDIRLASFKDCKSDTYRSEGDSR